MATFSRVEREIRIMDVQPTNMYNIYVRETGQFSSKIIIYDFIGNLNKITVLRLITESASNSLNEPYNISTGY